jgi:hypothetical protein
MAIKDITPRQKLLEVQKEIGAIKKDATNPYFKSKYFDINSLLEQVKPVLNKHGLILTQALTHLEGKLALRTSILDADSQDIYSDVCPLPEVADPQKAGSAVTYFRRYALQSLLALEAEDDDANSASGKKEKSSGNYIEDIKNSNEDPLL